MVRSVKILSVLLTVTAICSVVYILILQSYYSVVHAASPAASEDKMKQYNERRIDTDDIESQMPSLPFTFWNKSQKLKLQMNKTCALFPNIVNLKFNNIYWQTVLTSNGTIQIFGAYVDIRKANTLGPSIKLLVMIDRIQPNISTFCQLWSSNNNQPVIMPVVEYKYVWIKNWGNYKQGIYQPYILACKMPKQKTKTWIPSAVSLVENSCDNATTLVKIIYNKPETKKDFGVCVKGLLFPSEDISLRLIEWIELLHILGADMIYMYELSIHPNVKKLLNYYEQEGKVHISQLTLAGNQPNGALLEYFLRKKIVNKRQDELIPYNDCFYKHMYEYKYLIMLDTDEIVVPLKEINWKNMMNNILKKALAAKNVDRSSYEIRNVYFLDQYQHKHGWNEEIPKYMHMMQHVYRAKSHTKPGYYIKSFFNTEKVTSVHNHYPLGCFGPCRNFAVSETEAQLQHYRKSCMKELRSACLDFEKNNVRDSNIWRYKEELSNKVKVTIKALNISTYVLPNDE